jgi:hypothetical protein
VTVGRLVAALVGVISCVSCTSDSGPPNGAEIEGTASSSESFDPNVESDETNSFVNFFWSDEVDEAGIQREIDQKTSDCMQKRGFAYPLSPPPAPNSSQSNNDPRGYGVVDEFVAPRKAEDSFTAPVDQYLRTLSPEARASFLEALNGKPPSGGCVQQASAQLQAELPRFDPSYSEILDDYYAALNTDEQVLERTTQWSRCVEEKTQLLSATGSTLRLTRGNIHLAVYADIAARLGRSVKWITQTEAETLDSTSLPEPVNVVVDVETGIGYLIWGPQTRLGPDAIESATQRELEIQAADNECWLSMRGEERIHELQDEAMEKIALLSASSG